jgi:hypothetical protein
MTTRAEEGPSKGTTARCIAARRVPLRVGSLHHAIDSIERGVVQGNDAFTRVVFGAGRNTFGTVHAVLYASGSDQAEWLGHEVEHPAGQLVVVHPRYAGELLEAPAGDCGPAIRRVA